MKYFVLIAVCSVAALSSCKNDQDGSKGAVERHNEKVAQEAVRAIKTPLDQAKAAAAVESAHTKQLEDQLKTP